MSNNNLIEDYGRLIKNSKKEQYQLKELKQGKLKQPFHLEQKPLWLKKSSLTAMARALIKRIRHFLIKNAKT